MLSRRKLISALPVIGAAAAAPTSKSNASVDAIIDPRPYTGIHIYSGSAIDPGGPPRWHVKLSVSSNTSAHACATEMLSLFRGFTKVEPTPDRVFAWFDRRVDEYDGRPGDHLVWDASMTFWASHMPLSRDAILNPDCCTPEDREYSDRVIGLLLTCAADPSIEDAKAMPPGWKPKRDRGGSTA